MEQKFMTWRYAGLFILAIVLIVGIITAIQQLLELRTSQVQVLAVILGLGLGFVMTTLRYQWLRRSDD